MLEKDFFIFTNGSAKKKNSIYYFLIITAFLTYIVLTGAKNLYVAEKTTMYDLGIIGPFSGAKPRQVIISRERYNEMLMNSEDE